MDLLAAAYGGSWPLLGEFIVALPRPVRLRRDDPIVSLIA